MPYTIAGTSLEEQRQPIISGTGWMLWHPPQFLAEPIPWGNYSQSPVKLLEPFGQKVSIAIWKRRKRH